MKGLVMITDGSETHVIPRAEVRHIEIRNVVGYKDAWELDYMLTGTNFVRTVRWHKDCRPESLKNQTTIGEYNESAAKYLQVVLTRGHRDVHLERRSDGVFFVRSGLIEDDARAVMCRQFIAEMALTVVQTAIGPLNETQMHMIWEMKQAARDLKLPDWYPLDEGKSP
jgi:hypothetical protein